MVDEVTVFSRADGDFEVEVRRGSAITHHVVRVPPGMGAALGHADLEPSALVRVSFTFLLEREPPTSILPTFGLDVVERYFPEYPHEMARRLGDVAGPA